ncbi:MAG: acyl-CoA dehydrogenase family protein, partial [Pseudomonadota bacterium]|nr:acyl-CoA dehydrogenase family protein [Pseudomonadota bacterium]
KGEIIGCFMLSEPGSGSDASSIETSAEKTTDGYVINGRKKFVTGGNTASVALVAVKTDKSLGKKGISLFLIPREKYEIDRLENKMGHRNVDTADVVFNDSLVSDDALLGEVGDGYLICLKLLNTGRIGVAAQGVGVAVAAFNKAKSYAMERKAFNKTLIEHQSVAFRLTDMATRISSARQLTLLAAAKADSGERCIAECSMAKVYASEVAEQVTSDAVQIFGGDGYLKEAGVEKLFRDARVLSIYEGTNDIQKIVISREIQNGWSPE